MPGRSPLAATAEQKAALQELSRSDVRGEADRARAILLTLQGWTSVQLARHCCMNSAGGAVGWANAGGLSLL